MAQQRIRVGALAFRTCSRGYAAVGRSGHFVRTGRREATGGEIYKRWELTHTRSVCVGVAETGGKPSYMTFAALFVSEKRDKGKVTLSKK